MDLARVQSDNGAIAIEPDIPIGADLVDTQRTAHALDTDRAGVGDSREGACSGDQVDRCRLGPDAGLGMEVQVHAVHHRAAVELADGPIDRGQRHGAAVIGDIAAQPDVADALDVEHPGVVAHQFDVDCMVGLDALGEDVLHADLGAPVHIIGFLDAKEAALSP